MVTVVIELIDIIDVRTADVRLGASRSSVPSGGTIEYYRVVMNEIVLRNGAPCVRLPRLTKDIDSISSLRGDFHGVAVNFVILRSRAQQIGAIHPKRGIRMNVAVS